MKRAENLMRYLFAALLVFLYSCSSGPNELSITPLESPAGDGAGEPNLFASFDGRTYLSWVEPLDGGHALRFSEREGGAWAPARTVAQGENWFVNWADFPSLVRLTDGTLTAHWLQKSADDTYAYDVVMSRSIDNGATWTGPLIPHTDGTPTEHGFVSMLPWSERDVLIVWLDGRNFAVSEGGGDAHGNGKNMTLRSAILNESGELRNETVLDDRTCDCCPTSAALTTNGAIVSYRDRSENEIRDISIVRFESGAWSAPATIYADRWEVAGCPVNGPALDASGSRVVCAWFTNADNDASARVAFSSNGGRSWGAPIDIDDGDPLGRVDVVLLDDGSALVSWLEIALEEAEVRVRRVYTDGRIDPAIVASPTSKERASGFPRMVANGYEIVFAWTEADEPSHVRTAVMSLR